MTPSPGVAVSLDAHPPGTSKCAVSGSRSGGGRLTKQQRGERRSRGSGRTRRVDRFALCRTKRLREARRTEEVRRAAQASAAGVVGAARRGTTAGQRAWFICTVLMTSHEAMRRTYASGSTRRPHMEHVSNDNGRSSGSAVEAASPGGATSVANSLHIWSIRRRRGSRRHIP